MNDEQMTARETVEIELTDREKRVLQLLAAGEKLPTIRSIVFGKNKMTRQGVYEFVQSAIRKQWRLNAKERHAKRLQDCPIAELPIPSRIRNALIAADFEKVGQIADMSREDFARIPGIGKRHGSFLIYTLMQSWDVQKPKSFCPNCGAGLTKKLREGENELNCSNCGGAFDVEANREVAHA